MFALLLMQNVKCLFSIRPFGGGGRCDVRGIDRRSFTLCNQPRLFFFPPPFTAIRLFIVLGISVHRVFHRFLVGVEENVLQSGKKTISQDLSSPFFLFLFLVAQRGGLTFGTRYQVSDRIRI